MRRRERNGMEREFAFKKTFYLRPTVSLLLFYQFKPALCSVVVILYFKYFAEREGNKKKERKMK